MDAVDLYTRFDPDKDTKGPRREQLIETVVCAAVILDGNADSLRSWLEDSGRLGDPSMHSIDHPRSTSDLSGNGRRSTYRWSEAEFVILSPGPVATAVTRDRWVEAAATVLADDPSPAVLRDHFFLDRSTPLCKATP